MSKAFFDSLRAALGPLAQNQVDGVNHLLQATSDLPLRHRAYVLATAWHETGPASSPLHMTPRREIWGPTDAQKRYEGRKDLGNTIPGDGKKFMGRGFCQLTGRAGYQRASRVVGRDLVMEPDLALDPNLAARIIVAGMRDGWFTGKTLADFDSFREMRRVVNGTDKADLIAGYAEAFERALKASAAQPVAPAPAPPATPAPEPPASPPAATSVPPAPIPETPAQSIAKWLIAAVGALVAILAAWMMKG